MTWRVDIDHRAERELAALPDEIFGRIMKRLNALANDPYPRGVKRLRGGSGYRIRVGDYRVLYDVFTREAKIIIYAVGHRRDVYR